MGVLKNLYNNAVEGFKKLSGATKTAVIVFVCGLITAMVYLIIFMTRPQYEPLFMNMTPEDMAKVVDTLKQDKISYKLQGTTILVPEDMVEELRLDVMSSGVLPSNGKGFELFDESRFGITDTETKILYQRALETELQRTIKAFDEIEYARVHLVLPEPSVFVRNEEQARASVTLKIKNGKKLSQEQVKAIIAIISGSVKNLPKQNVEVIDSNFNYLSENLGNDDINSASSVSNRYDIKRQFESKIEGDIKKMLEAVFGQNKVKISVNAELDFDSKQTTSIKYDTQGIIKSQNRIKETTNNTSGQVSGSPINNQTTPSTTSGNNTSTSTREEETTNYNVGQVEEKTIKAPGEVKKISTSVVIDSPALSDAQKASVTNIVMAATGYNQNRGDLVTVEAMAFDTALKKQMEQDLKALEDLQKAEERNKRLITFIGYPAAGLAGLIFFLVLMSRLRKKKKENGSEKLDIVINEPIPVNEVIKKQIILEEDNEPDLVGELKNYASRKPEQVVEIVKSWLSEDEG